MHISNEHDFARWAKTLPPHLRKRASAIIAIRAAARVFPLLAHELRLADEPEQKEAAANSNVLPAVLYLQRAYSSEQNRERYAPYNHYRFASAYPEHTASSTFRVTWAAQAAAEVSSFTERAYVSSVRAASSAIERSVSAAASIRRVLARQAILQAEADIQFFIDSKFNLEALFHEQLWTNSEARVDFDRFWNELRSYLINIDNNWVVWTDWYDGIFRGYIPYNVSLSVYKKNN
ncbi:hypothetical protein [Bosea sp. Leaf344]|uniref:hypothetical protein n=1 Tax=Bosea sp. Leaf344 TaxID=1736346 RepID=UPI000AC5FCB7|nr:hypothetical protein [Bosea sp. Leaf344]